MVAPLAGRRVLDLGAFCAQIPHALAASMAARLCAAYGAEVVRPVPDIIAAFSKRVVVLGAQPPPPKVRDIDYLSILDDARPRTHKKRRRFE